MGSQILYAQEDNSIILKREVSTDSKKKIFYRSSHRSDIPNLYKLWNIDYEKMVIYDDKSGLNTVSLSHKTIKYNDIDKNDLDISSVFEKYKMAQNMLINYLIIQRIYI